MTKRISCFFLALMMILSMLPAPAFAEDTEPGQEASVTEATEPAAPTETEAPAPVVTEPSAPVVTEAPAPAVTEAPALTEAPAEEEPAEPEEPALPSEEQSSEPEETQEASAPAVPEETEAEEPNSEETEPEENEPEETEPEETEPEETEPEETEPDETEPEETEPEETEEAGCIHGQEEPCRICQVQAMVDAAAETRDADTLLAAYCAYLMLSDEEQEQVDTSAVAALWKWEGSLGLTFPEELAFDFGASTDELLTIFLYAPLMGDTSLLSTDLHRDRFDGYALQIYEAALQMIKNVADGSQTNTQFTVTLDSVTVTSEDLGTSIVDENGELPEEVRNAAFQKVLEQLTLGTVLQSVIRDCPYEAYWAVKGYGYSSRYGYTYSQSSIEFSNITLTFAIPASEEFADPDKGEYYVDTAKTSAAADARENALTIVSRYAGVSDRDKLYGYATEICNKNTYNYDAANGNYGYSYGNPWQLIYVLDNDPTTNSVCEGYSKAFLYLCELTSFSSPELYAFTVEGDFRNESGSGGGHMWNVVHMPDGKNYLVDVTNMDQSWIVDELFLAGTDRRSEEDHASWYYVLDANILGDLTYTYYPSMFSYYRENELTLAETSYGSSAPAPLESILPTAENTPEGIRLAWSQVTEAEGYYVYRKESGESDYTQIASISSADTVSYTDTAVKESSGTSYTYAVRAYNGSTLGEGTPVEILRLLILASGDCGEKVTWTLDSEGLLTISGTGEMTDYEVAYDELEISAPWDSARVCSVVIESGVTSIGNYAFYDCSNLTSITIPGSVTSIGGDAFRDCFSLTCVTIPDNVTSIGDNAFNSCWALTSIIIPEGVTSISKCLFMGCSGLTSVTIPSSVTSIDECAFSHCESLTSATIPDSVTSIGSSAFSYCSSLTSIIIPEGVTSIGSYAFSNCGSLTEINVDSGNRVYCSVSGVLYSKDKTTLISCPEGKMGAFTIPSSVTAIGDAAFCRCSSLTSITIPDSVTSISDWAFDECSSLTSITLPESVTSIGNSAFSSCGNLMNITIPGSVTSISDWMFYGCSSLTNITIPSSVTSIGSSAFSYCSSLTSITLPDSVTSIGDFAFHCCSSLTSITIPKSVTDIRGYAFPGCSSLTEINVDSENSVYCSVNGVLYSKDKTTLINCPEGKTGAFSIPGGVISIDRYSFHNCSGLISLTIPDSVTSIGDCVFLGCSNLTSITIPSTVTSVGWNAFGDCSSLTDVYYAGSEEQVSAIEISDDNECLQNAVWHYAEDVTSTVLASGDCGENVTWTLDSDGLLTISGTGEMIDYDGWDIFAPWDSASVRSVVIESGVTCIGERAFCNCSNLTSITIPDSVISIGWYAFTGCSSLTSITLPKELTSIDWGAFYNCSELTSIIIPDGVTNIGNSTFYGCSKLTSITIPNSVTSIDSSAFDGCSSLTSIDIPEGVTSIGNWAFSDCSSLTSITIPEGVTSIGDGTFCYCSSLTSVSIPDSVMNIGSSAFNGCSRLTNITIPGSVTSVGSYTFYNCSRLTSITIPEGVTSIGEGAFSSCSSLMSITIPESVTSIGKSAFSSCSNLTSATIPEGVTSIGEWAFVDCSRLTSITIPEGVTNIGDGTFCNCSSLTSVSIPDSVTSIGNSAFNACSHLTSITIPEGVTSIGEWAFSYCSSLAEIIVAPENENYSSLDGVLFDKDKTALIKYPAKKTQTAYRIPAGVTSIIGQAFSDCSSLTSITIPEGVTSIGNSVFSGCSRLASITIPEGVTSIGGSVFSGCSRLTSITISDSVTSIGESAFSGCSSLTSITIPDSVISIADRAFSFCSGLTSVVIPDSVTCIGESAFSWCDNLTSITIPASVTSIGYEAFRYCSSLKRILFLGDAPEFDSFVFEGVTATAFYPKDNSTWTEAVRQDYGGTITWRDINDFYNSGYTVKFLANAEEATGSTEPLRFEKGTANLTANGFARPGYKFAGWNTKANGSGTTYANKASVTSKAFPKGSKELTLYAKWTKVKYTITYNLNKGTNSSKNPASYYITTADITLAKPTRKGYTFLGWFDNEACEGEAITVIPKGSTGKKTLYAKWEKTVYTITYNLNGGENNEANPDTYTITTATITLAKPTRTGYTFKGWFSNSTFKTQVKTIAKGSTGNKTLYAKWAKTKYTITYKLNGGTNSSKNPASYYITTADINLEKPTRKGYTFQGWFDNADFTGEAITVIPTGGHENRTLYAKWQENSYTVAFDGNHENAAGETAPMTVTYTEKATLTANGFTRLGYKFVGWNTKADGSGTAYANNVAITKLTATNGKEITLYAQWKKATYTITYKLNGGTNAKKNPTSFTITSADINLLNPTKKGFTFDGWYDNPEFVGDPITLIPNGSHENVTLYAKWTEHSYTIAFNANKGTGEMDSIVDVAYSTKVTLTANSFTRSGYKFVGWNTKANGSGTTYANKAAVSKLTATDGGKVTLYAQWKKK